MADAEEPEPQPLKFENAWVKIQENTFINWINQQLRDTEHKIETLDGAFNDGVLLCALVAALQGQNKINGMKQNPKNRHQRIENVTLALNACKADKVKMVNIGPEDIVNGNMKLIMGLAWSFILRYQIGKSKVPPKQLMLAWIHAVIPQCKINNFTTDWNNGKALSALIDYCEPGLCPDWKTLNASNRAENCENAMRLAQERLGVPMILSPTDMASADLDPLSGMTYISYFMKLNSCGYRATLRDVNRILAPNTVQNFVTDWRDGAAVSNLVHSVGGHIPGYPDLPTYDPLHCTKTGLQAGKEIDIDPIMSAEEMINPHEGHLGVMAYAARFVHKKVIKKKAAEMLEIVFNTVNISVEQRTPFTLLMKQGEPQLHDITVSITDSHGTSVPSTLEWTNNETPAQGKGLFAPTNSGTHKMVIQCDNDTIRGCPISFNVSGGRNSLTVVPVDLAVINQATPVEVISESGIDDIKICSISPSGVNSELSLIPGNNGRAHVNNFVPDVIGEWRVELTKDGQNIPGSPLSIKVINPAAVYVHDLVGTGRTGDGLSFFVDTDQAGDADLKCDIYQEGRLIPCEIIPESDGRYKVSFTAQGPGVHTIKTFYGGLSCQDRPFTMQINDSNLVVARGPGLELACVDRVAYFDVHTKNAGTGEVEAVIYDAKNESVAVDKKFLQTSGVCQIQYTPKTAGQYKIEVMFSNKPINGSPFTVEVYSPDLHVHVPKTSQLNKNVDVIISTANCGKGSLNITVTGPKGEVLKVETQRLSHERYQAVFVPKTPGEYLIQMDFNSQLVKGSPWRVDIASPHVPVPPVSPPPANGPERIPVGILRSFDISSGNSKALDVKIVAPSQANVPYSAITTSDQTLTIKYMLQEVGEHKFHVFSNGQPARGSPFLVPAFDPNLVVVHGLDEHQLGVPVKIQIDQRLAGDGDIQVKISGKVLELTKVSNKFYETTFTPQSPTSVEVTLNDHAVKGSPFQYPSDNPIYSVPVKVDIPSVISCDQGTRCSVLTSDIDIKQLQVTITDPTGVTKQASTHSGSNSRQIVFDVTPTIIGTHSIDVKYKGTAAPSSPYTVKAIELKSPKLILSDGLVGKDSVLLVRHNNCGTSDITARMLSPSNEHVDCRYVNMGSETQIIYTPQEPGEYKIHLYGGGLALPDCPRYVHVKSPTPVRESTGLPVIVGLVPMKQVDKQQEFYIEMNGCVGQPDIRVEGPKSVAKCDVVPMSVNQGGPVDKYRVTYFPVEAGFYTGTVMLNGKHVINSPFSMIILDPRKIVLLSSPHISTDDQSSLLMNVNQPITLEFEDLGAGPGELKIKSTHKQTGIPLQTNIIENNKLYQVKLTADQDGLYDVQFNWSSFNIPHTPFRTVVSTDADINGNLPGKVIVSGEGTKSASINEQTEFIIDATQAGPGNVNVYVTNSQLSTVPASITLSPMSSLVYKCSYQLNDSGQYLLNVHWNGRQVDGSPFPVAVTDNTLTLSSVNSSIDELNGIKVSGSGLENGILNDFKGEFIVDASRSGKGQLVLKIFGPKGLLPYKTKQSDRKSVKVFNFDPTEVGPYSIHMEWNGQKIPICPIPVHIFDARDELDRFNKTGELPYTKSTSYANDNSARYQPDDEPVRRVQSVPQPSHYYIQNPAPRRAQTVGEARYQQNSGQPAPLQHRNIKSSFIVHENAPATTGHREEQAYNKLSKSGHRKQQGLAVFK